MAIYKLVVFTDNVEGMEREYNEWYNNVHLSDVVAVKGFTGAQRFKLESAILGTFSNRYLAIYDIETDDPQAVIERLLSLQGTDAMFISPALSSEGGHVALFKECSPMVVLDRS